MLPYLLIMLIATSNNTNAGISTINIPMPDQQTCIAIKSDIDQKVNNAGGKIFSENCYSMSGGTGYGG